MKIVLKIFLVIVILLVVLGAAAFVLGPKLNFSVSGMGDEDDATPVIIHELGAAKLVEFVSAPGEVEPHTKVDISAEVSARIEALPFNPGDQVRKGDVIVRLDDRDLKAALESTIARRDGEKYRLQAEQARIVGIQSNLEFARKELERMRSLYDTGDVSRKSLDDAEARVQDLDASLSASQYNTSVIESSLAASEADIERARDGLDNTVIHAPMDGTVTAVDMEVGEQVLGTFNNIGTQIMTIANLSRMLLKAEVAESDIAAVKEGQSAKIHINAYPDETFRGTVTEIALQRTLSSDGTGVFRVEVEIDLQGRRIYSGHAANVDIEIEEHEGLVVESQAIVERLIENLPTDIRKDPVINQQKRITTVIYRVVDGKAVCTPVKPGPSDLTHTLIEKGANAGDKVVIGPYSVLESIKHDQRVRDRDAPTEDDSPEMENGEVAETVAVGSDAA